MRAGAPLIAAAWLAAALPAAAAYTEEPLEPEQAFPVRAAVARDAKGQPQSIQLRFSMPPGYYLYRDRFRVEAPGLPLGSLRVPPGIAKNDPFVGPSRIFKRAVTLTVPFASPPVSGTYEVRVTAQGCAEDRVCYAPFAQNVQVSIP